MKRDRILNALVAAVLAFALAYTGIGCLVSAYGWNVDMATLGWSFALTALIGAALLLLSWGGTVILAGSALTLGYFWQNGTLFSELESFAYVISRPWYSGYGWAFLEWEPSTGSEEVTFGLALLGCLTVLAAVWVLCRRKNLFFALLPAFLPLAACFVVTDTVPEVTWLFWFALVGILLVLTHGVRRRSAADGLKLTAILLIPIFLASVLLFAALPESEYERQLTDLQQTVLSWMQGLPFVAQRPDGQLGLSTGGVLERNMDLTTVGPRRLPRYTVLNVVSDRAELLYLRGQAMDVYNGISWAATADQEEDIYWPTEGLVSGGSLTVEIRTGQSVLYFPYYTGGELWSTDFEQGSLPNPDSLRNYTVERLVPGDGQVTWSQQTLNELYTQCLALPEDTGAWAQSVLIENHILFMTDTEDIVSAIGILVQNSAQYNLETGRMPEEETDFARWFWEESETGYCVHFATTATVFLRAAGVPARFVTGYVQEVEAGVPTSITADRSHAWVEYLHPTQGWKILDPTPAIGIPEVTFNTEPTETEETTAPTEETTLPTETTAPTEDTTAPTELTVPPTKPTAATQTVATEPVEAEDPAEAPPAPIWQGIWVIGGVFVGILLILGQYALRRRMRRLYQGEPNRQAIRRWLYVARLCRYLKLGTPKALWELTEKAMFSQHTLTEAELAQYTRFIQQAHEVLRKKPLFKRLWLRFALGLG